MSSSGKTVLRLTPDEYLEVDSVVPRMLGLGERACYRVVRRSIDARHRRVRIVLTVEPSLPGPPVTLENPFGRCRTPTGKQVVVVGAGPAGLFASLALLEGGVAPVILDRGISFPDRHYEAKKVRLYGEQLRHAPMTCGLGGAGAFSDGKLHTRKGGKDARRALRVMAFLAGDEGLLVDAHPHVGSNRLPRVMDAFREYLDSLGARFFFNTEVTELVVKGERIIGVGIDSGEKVLGDAVVLAPGNSARTLVAALHRQRVAMEPKSFAIGARVEHPQQLIDRIQYGDMAGHPALGAARYAFAFSDGPRPVYSFCMCPGGYVIPTPPEPGRLAVNGMSHSTRGSGWSNAALVTAVSAEDWSHDSSTPLGGVAFQRQLEGRFYEAGGGDCRAPAQRVTDFLAGKCSSSLPESSYRPGLSPSCLRELLPGCVVESLRDGLRRADERMRGYICEEGLLIGPETLTSSPVRIMRSHDGESISHPGLHPCGEGSGWAGGITSSAADGLACGEAVAKRVRLVP